MPRSSSPSSAAESVRRHRPFPFPKPPQELTPSLVYIFTGSILLDVHTLDKVFGSIIGIIGLAYVVLEFIPSIEPPQNMRCDLNPPPGTTKANPPRKTGKQMLAGAPSRSNLLAHTERSPIYPLSREPARSSHIPLSHARLLSCMVTGGYRMQFWLGIS
jgi:hypothetical protein